MVVLAAEEIDAAAERSSLPLQRNEDKQTDGVSDRVDHSSASSGQKADGFGTEVPAAASKKQTRSRRGATRSRKSRGSVVASSQKKGRKARKPRGKPRSQQARTLPRRLPPDQLLTLAAVEEALIALEENPNDVTEAVSAVRRCCMKRAFEKSFLPHAEAAIRRLGLKIDIWKSAKDLTPKQQPVDVGISENGGKRPRRKVEVRGQITPVDVLARLLPRIRRQHWVYEIDEAQASPELLARYGALKEALENTNYLKDMPQYAKAEDDPADSAEGAKVPAVNAELGMGPNVSAKSKDLQTVFTPAATAVLIALLISGVLMRIHEPRSGAHKAHSVDESSPVSSGEAEEKPDHVSGRKEDTTHDDISVRGGNVEQGGQS